MCIVFISSVQHTDGGYRLIVASNRDENYNRPTLSADYWSEDPDVIGGRDLEPSSVGGAWLAINVRRGKLAVLLNVFAGRKSRPNDQAAESRGQLVENFVKSDVPAKDYVRGLPDVYNGFKLITITMSKSSLETHYFTNCDARDEDQSGERVPNGNRGFGNGPFRKVAEGEKRFDEIVRKYGHARTKDTLIEELLGLLKWNKQHYPDEEIIKRTPNYEGENNQKYFSSIFVEMPNRQYGTRTHTIILVDHDGKTEYNEWTMCDSKWEHRCFTTSMKCYA